MKGRRFYPDEQGLGKFLSSGELEVMEAVWAGKHTTSAIRKHIAQQGKVRSIQAIRTTLLRMIEKHLVFTGALVFERVTFYPTETRADFIYGFVSGILGALYRDVELTTVTVEAAWEILKLDSAVIAPRIMNDGR